MNLRWVKSYDLLPPEEYKDQILISDGVRFQSTYYQGLYKNRPLWQPMGGVLLVNPVYWAYVNLPEQTTIRHWWRR